MKNIKIFLEKHSVYLILLLAAVTRLHQLGRRDFWYDEAFTGIAVKESWSGMMKMIMADVHPPLYYLSLKLFASFFDYSVFGVRLYSAIFGVLCVWAVYLFTKELFDKKAAVYASLIATISPFAWQYSQEGRMYSMFSFFIIMAAYFLVRALRVGTQPAVFLQKYRDYILFGLLLGLAALTHYVGIIFVPIFYLVYVVWNLYFVEAHCNAPLQSNACPLRQSCSEASQQGRQNFASLHCNASLQNVGRLIKKLLPNKQIIIAFTVMFLVFLPWIPNFINHLVKNAHSNNLDWIRPASFGDIPVNIQMFIFGTPLGEMSSGMPGPNEFYGIADISMWILVTVFMTAVIIYLLYFQPCSIVIPRLDRGIQKKDSRVDSMLNIEPEIYSGSGFNPEPTRKILSRFRLKGRNDNKALEVTTVLILSLGFMTLVWFLGFFGKYFFVARYLLAAGYFIFVLLGVWLSRIRLPYSALAIVFYVTMLFLTIPLGYSEGWNVFAKDLNKYQGKDFYILNSFDYVIAKYYLGADKLTLYNVDWPPYNPDYWAAIGKTLKRTENFDDLRNDKNALIISNTQLGGQDNKNFNPTGLELVAQYKNILVYKFQ